MRNPTVLQRSRDEEDAAWRAAFARFEAELETEYWNDPQVAVALGRSMMEAQEREWAKGEGQ